MHEHKQTQEVLTTIALQLSHGQTDPEEVASALSRFEAVAVEEALGLLDEIAAAVRGS